MNSIIPGVEETVRMALAEDIGSGDITTRLTVPPDVVAAGRFVARVGGVVAGLPAVREVFSQVDPALEFTAQLADGDDVSSGQVIANVYGSARSILTGERVALNFLQRLSGIATRTARCVGLVQGTGARIVDTRKTTPGLRALEKYAVRMGGGLNHRFGLFDAVLIKDNHIAAAGGITAAAKSAFAGAPHVMTVTVECESLDQVREALEAEVDIILLDNMSPAMLSEAVALIDGQAGVEASGRITEENLAEVAATGVNAISLGALTHSAPALDIALEISTT